MLKPVIEIVYRIFDNNGYFGEQEEDSPSDELDALFPGLHSIGVTRLYFILTTALLQPLTDEQKFYLSLLMAQGKILDYQVKEVVLL